MVSTIDMLFPMGLEAKLQHEKREATITISDASEQETENKKGCPRKLKLIMPATITALAALLLLLTLYLTAQSQGWTEHDRITNEYFVNISHKSHSEWNRLLVDEVERTLEVDVPQFGGFRRMIVLYDFKQGFWAAKDVSQYECYITRTGKTLQQVIFGLKTLRKSGNKTIPLLTSDVTALAQPINSDVLDSVVGSRIAKHCTDSSSYWLITDHRNSPVEKSKTETVDELAIPKKAPNGVLHITHDIRSINTNDADCYIVIPEVTSSRGLCVHHLKMNVM